VKINKLQIEKYKFDINLKFYFLLKQLVKSKLTEKQSLLILELLNLFNNSIKNSIERLTEFTYTIKGAEKRDILFLIIGTIEKDVDIDLLIFSLNLYLIKDLLLQEAKLNEVNRLSELKNLDQLSLAYDQKTVYRPYSTRVSGALLALLFFSKLEEEKTNFMSIDSYNFLKNLSKYAIKLKSQGIEPNQIFMLMFSESVNQSIISDSGSDYEDRILSVLIQIGIPEKDIKKIHDKDDASTEFDFFFELNKKTYGIGAKRTLRERYKQFIKTAQMSKIDIMIEITLGLDLNEEKAKTIISHGIYIFVADEIYKSREYLQRLNFVYSVRDLTLDTLGQLSTL
jgi:hypothetical protein